MSDIVKSIYSIGSIPAPPGRSRSDDHKPDLLEPGIFLKTMDRLIGRKIPPAPDEL